MSYTTFLTSKHSDSSHVERLDQMVQDDKPNVAGEDGLDDVLVVEFSDEE